MELDLIKQQIQTNKKLYDGRKEHIETTEIIVPDYLPDAKSIITSQAQINIKDKSTADDRLTVIGEIHFTALFAAEGDQTPVSVSTRTPFREVFTLPSATADIFSHITPSIGQNEARIINSRKIGFKAVIELDISVYTPQTFEAAREISSAVHIESLKRKNELCIISALASKQFNLEEDIILPQSKPQAKEILSYRPSISLDDVKLISGKAILKGSANIFCLYLSSEDTPRLETVENEIPFSLILDILGIDDTNDADASFEISDVNITIANDSDGRTFNASIGANAIVSVYKQTESESIIDAFSTTHELTLACEDTPVISLFENKLIPINIRDIINAPDNTSISKVIDVHTEASAFDISLSNGEIGISGSADIHALCIGSDNSLFSVKRTLPLNLSCETDCLGEKKIEVKSPNLNTSFNLNMSGDIEVRITGDILLKVFEQTNIHGISSASAEEKTTSSSALSPSLYAYFIEKGETLWDVAKKYGASPDNIRAVNKISCDTNSHPDGVNVLLIPRRSFT